MGAETNSPTPPTSQAASVIELPEEANIRVVQPQRDQLEAGLSRGALHLACQATTSIDIAFLQLIVSAKKTADAAGQKFTIDAPEDGILERAIARAGLQNELSGLIQREAG